VARKLDLRGCMDKVELRNFSPFKIWKYFDSFEHIIRDERFTVFGRNVGDKKSDVFNGQLVFFPKVGTEEGFQLFEK
jgi:hypothetical protein